MNTTLDQLSQQRTEVSTPVRPTSRRLVRIVLWLLAVFVIYNVAALGFHGWRAYHSGMALLTVVQTDPQLTSIAAMQPQLAMLARSIAGIEGQSRMFAPILQRLQGIPTYGNTLAALPDLLLAGRELTAVADESLALVAPALQSNQSLFSAQGVVALMAAQGSALVALGERAQIAADALDRVDAESLHPKLAGRLAKAKLLLPALPVGLKMAPALSTLLGVDKPKSYLILVQNNHELRATGGFISAVGRLTLDNGELSGMDFSDSYAVYVADHSYPKPPLAMLKYMNIPMLLFRDANWSPDLSTTAQTAKALYQQDMGHAIDGIITVDLNAVRVLINALGPLQLEGVDEPINGDNMLDLLKQLWERPITTDADVTQVNTSDWWAKRKDFVPLIARAAIAKLQGGSVESGSVDMQAVAVAAIEALDRRFVQVWIDDPTVTAVLGEQGWDGGLRAGANADYLALVDTNMGYNKVDSVLTRQIDYRVIWPQGNNGPGQATVTISYKHPFAVPAEDHCDPTPRYGNSYDDMAGRCYFDYVRLYVPSGSKLVKAEGFQAESVESLRGEKGTQLFAGYFVMKPGTTHTLRFTYTLPEWIRVENYRLLLQKQSGLISLPVTLDVNGHTFSTDLESGVLQWDFGQQ